MLSKYVQENSPLYLPVFNSLIYVFTYSFNDDKLMKKRAKFASTPHLCYLFFNFVNLNRKILSIEPLF